MMKTDEMKINSLFTLAGTLGEQTDYEEILRLVSAEAAALFDAEAASIVMINPGTKETIKTVVREVRGKTENSFQLAQTNMIGWVTKSRLPFLSANLEKDSRFNPDILDDFTGIRSAMCVPLISAGEEVGYLVVFNRKGGVKFTETDLDLLSKMSVTCAPFVGNVQRIRKFFEGRLTDSALIKKYAGLGMLGKCSAFLELLRTVEAAANSDVRVLLEGRTGTGKELVARAIHTLSARSQNPFIAIDCGAIPANLMESELFGHVKGAFTGATRDRDGLFVQAEGGTLFMDEISNLPLEMQAKLMRILQEGEVRPLGSSQVRKTDVRVITASSAPLQDLVGQKKFREDLYYRLLVYPVNIPSLEERRADIPLFTDYFIRKFSAQQGKKIAGMAQEILDFLKQRSWPGNIRELENYIERIVTFAPSDAEKLLGSILPPGISDEFEKFRNNSAQTNSESLPEKISRYEAELIREALVKNDWNQSAAARSLNLPEQTLRYKMNKLEIKS